MFCSGHAMQGRAAFSSSLISEPRCLSPHGKLIAVEKQGIALLLAGMLFKPATVSLCAVVLDCDANP
jgi:hypothetical protein